MASKVVCTQICFCLVHNVPHDFPIAVPHDEPLPKQLPRDRIGGSVKEVGPKQVSRRGWHGRKESPLEQSS
jgi:hypothetical protein